MNDFIRTKINEFNRKYNLKIPVIKLNDRDYAVFEVDSYAKNTVGFGLSVNNSKLLSFVFHKNENEANMSDPIYTDEILEDEEDSDLDYSGLEKQLINDFELITNDWLNYKTGSEHATKLGDIVNAVVSYAGDEDIEFVYRRFRTLLGKIKEAEADKDEGAFVNNSKLAEINKENLNYYYFTLIDFIFRLDGGENNSLINEDMLDFINPYVKKMYKIIFEDFSRRDTMIDIGDLFEITEVEIDDETAEFGFESIYKKGTPVQLSELLDIKNNVKIKDERVNKWIELWNAISGGNPDFITAIYSGLSEEDKKDEKGRYLANGDNIIKLDTLEFIYSSMLDEKDADFKARMAKDVISISMDSNNHYMPKSDIIDLVYDSLVDINIESAVIFYEFTEVEPSNNETKIKMYDYIESH